MSIVSVTELSKKYGDFEAVKNISFDIQQGEIFGFLGPNGAGKTSTINMLIGLSRPSSGSISIDGIDGIREIKKVQKIMGIVPDESNLYDEMDGFENLCFCASLYGMSKKEREKAASRLLEQFNLKFAGKRPFRTYSKGMKRKLTIAAGIIHDPKILFLDEPTTGVDVESARRIRSLISALKEKGTTIFLTTHYIEEAERICDRIAFIVDGRIVKTGTVAELLENLEHKHIMRLALKGDAAIGGSDLKQAFPHYEFDLSQEGFCSIASQSPVELLPVLQYLDSKSISVYEAKEIRPTLEDVFVQVTGIEADKLAKEKERKK